MSSVRFDCELPNELISFSWWIVSNFWNTKYTMIRKIVSKVRFLMKKYRSCKINRKINVFVNVNFVHIHAKHRMSKMPKCISSRTTQANEKILDECKLKNESVSYMTAIRLKCEKNRTVFGANICIFWLNGLKYREKNSTAVSTFVRL